MKFKEDQSEPCDSFIISFYGKDLDNYIGIKTAIDSYILNLEEDYKSDFEFATVTEIEPGSDNCNFSVDITRDYFDDLFEYTFNLIENTKKMSADILNYKLLVEQEDGNTLFASVHPDVYELYLDQKNPPPELMYYPYFSNYEELFDAAGQAGIFFKASDFGEYEHAITLNS
jgi:hypothetical protein